MAWRSSFILINNQRHVFHNNHFNKKQHKNPLNLYIVKQFVPFCLQQLCKLALLKMKERKDKKGKTPKKKGDKVLVQEGKSQWIATTRLLCQL
jgi:hypothetical protein